MRSVLRRASATTPRPPSRIGMNGGVAYMADSRIEFIGRVKHGLFAVVLAGLTAVPVAADAGVQAAARLSVQVWAHYCVMPLLAGAPLTPGLEALERRSASQKNVTREWWVGHGTILAEMRAKNGESGCYVTMSPGQRATQKTLRIVEQNFDVMMHAGVLAEHFERVVPCADIQDHIVMFESKAANPNGYFVKAFLNTRDDLGFLHLVGAEADRKPHSCPSKEES